MCVYLQGEIWWYEFTVHGKRIRKSSMSTDKSLAKLIEAEHRRSVELGTGDIPPTLEAIKATKRAERWMLPPTPETAAPKEQVDGSANKTPADLPKPKSGPTQKYTAEPKATPGMTVREAGEIWLTAKRDWKRRKPKTVECNAGYLRHLIRFFGDTRLVEIQPRSILAYQTARSKEVGASAVNHEVNALSQILKLCGLWGPIRDYYRPLEEPEWQKPKVFTLDEQRLIFETAKDDPELELAEIVFTITRNTSASGCELRLSRLQNIDLNSPQPTLHITGDITKNDVRPRVIPLNAAALNAFRRAVDRAARLGSWRPEHHLFPLRVNRVLYDPDRPASKSWLRKQTAKLRERTGIEHLRPQAWRHQLCTELLEQGVPDQTVIGLMGWCSRQMIETYSHTRIKAKAAAIAVLEQIGEKGPESQTPEPQTISVPDIMHPAIQAEISRQVAIALQERFAAPERPTRRRRTTDAAEVAAIEAVTIQNNPSTRNVIAFPGPRSA